MKLKIKGLGNKNLGEKELPSQFHEPYRPDLIRRAVEALQSAARQSYGASPLAGLRHSSKLSKRRRDYRGCYGFGISRVNRKIHSRRGMRFSWIGAFSPQTRGGRRSHPPTAQKNWERQINSKENRKAIRSALAATVDAHLVMQRGHHIPIGYPFIVAGGVEDIKGTKDVEKFFQELGFEKELLRAEIKKVRPGRGKFRGRHYRRKKGVLIVVSDNCPLVRAASNIPGTDIIPVTALNAEVLAPGALPGRVTVWTERAIDLLREKRLYL